MSEFEIEEKLRRLITALQSRRPLEPDEVSFLLKVLDFLQKKLDDIKFANEFFEAMRA